MKPIITLTTDFGIKEHHVALVKANIYNELLDVQIVDVSHHVDPFDIQEAGYYLERVYKHLPKGSVHIIGVDSEHSKTHLLFEKNGHFFIANNNGVISFIDSEYQPEQVYELIDFPTAILWQDFPCALLYTKVACRLIEGVKPHVLARPIRDYQTFKGYQPYWKSSTTLVGHAIHLDHYGNVITNITAQMMGQSMVNKSFKIEANRRIIVNIVDQFSDMISTQGHQTLSYGKSFIKLDAHNHIMIALYKSNLKTVGGASNLLGLKVGDEIIIEFIS